MTAHERQSLNAEDLTSPPHAAIIAKGPPPGCVQCRRAPMAALPRDPLVVYDEEGKVATVSVESDALWIEGESRRERIFFSEMKIHFSQDIPDSEY